MFTDKTIDHIAKPICNEIKIRTLISMLLGKKSIQFGA